MNSHHLTIAKASFAAALLRPDATNLSRDEISTFHTLLEAVVSKCTPSNVQNCKEWIWENVTVSSQRVTALGKYLASLSKNVREKPLSTHGHNASTTSLRQRLHILYLLNDLLHHAKFHSSDQGVLANLLDGLRPHLSDIVPRIPPGGKDRVRRRLQDLLRLWEQDGHLSAQKIQELQEENTPTQQDTELSNAKSVLGSSTRHVPYIMPSHHGDPSTPYYDLPAANLMPHIVPNKSISMRPDQVRALQLSAGPADETLVNAVKNFLRDVERMENPYETFEQEDIDADMDEIGNFSYRNETDEVIGDTYYGWSRAFCEKMKSRQQESDHDRRRSRSDSNSRGHSSSRSRSRSLSRNSPKRRRYDYSRSRSNSPIRPMFRSDSGSRPPRDNVSEARIAFQPSTNNQVRLQAPASVSTMTSSHIQQLSSIPPPPPPLPVGPDGLGFIPPRPPNYEGAWPPPPPPPPPPSNGFLPMPFVPTQRPHRDFNSNSRSR